MAAYADIPAGDADTGHETTRLFRINDEYTAWATFIQRRVGRSYGYDGWDAWVEVRRNPSHHVKGEADLVYPDPGDLDTTGALVRHADGEQAPSAEAIRAAGADILRLAGRIDAGVA